MPSLRHVVIVGAGRAGASAAAALRAEGFDGSIRLVGDESLPPYERPPLSKAVLAGTAAAGAQQVLAPDFYREQHVELLLGQAASAVDLSARCVELAGGARLSYDHLILATGARARRLPPDLDPERRALALRDAADATRLAAALASPRCRHVIVVGGGVIGLEVAAAARAAGRAVTVVEAGPRIMGRVLPAALAPLLKQEHERHGVRILEAVHPRRLTVREAATSTVDADVAPVRLDLGDGSAIVGDLVVAGIGAVPQTALAQAAGLHCDDGILVDEFGATSDPAVSAVGDAARFLHPTFGRALRVESWQHAQRHAAAVARHIAGQREPGQREPYVDVPWMWSEQFGLELQAAGLLDDGDESVVRTSADGSVTTVFALRGGALRGVAALGPDGKIGRDVRVAQLMIERGVKVAAAALADPDVRMKSLMSSAPPAAPNRDAVA